ncbi:hypothetical protein [uncultured Friedmanniella sp.]|uniref:hypothetical protein n=1 Tax=uncultured Friedmanniella sp. TaxID=335381 RepID=UPI0035C9D142
MAQTATTSSSGLATPTPLLRALQVLAGLAVLNVLFQFITAGQLFPSGGPDQLHAAGAILLHVVSGLATIAAFVLWRTGRITLGLAALTFGVFVWGFIQAAIGGYDTLYLHVPGAMLLTGGVVWLFLASLRARSR